MEVVKTVAAVRRIRRRDDKARWGLVPTMGSLHEGHLSLVRRAREENQRVGASIFVNPTQFNDPADLQHYPRDLHGDLAQLERAGIDLVWAPEPQVVYPRGYQTYVEVERLSRPLEGAARPGHFRGVATVVAKLFNIFQPHRAYFGQKDAQQVAVIRRMVADLNFNLDVVVCATVREADGLAMSSRNARLSAKARKQAICLYRALQEAEEMIAGGERDVAKIKARMREVISGYNLARIDYLSLAHPHSLRELKEVHGRVLVSLAVFIDNIRLIDNLVAAPA